MEAIHQLYVFSDKCIELKRTAVWVCIITLVILIIAALIRYASEDEGFSGLYAIIYMIITSIYVSGAVVANVMDNFNKEFDYSDNTKTIVNSTIDYMASNLTANKITNVESLSETEKYTEFLIRYIDDIGPQAMTVRLHPNLINVHANKNQTWNIEFAKYYEQDKCYYSKVTFYYPETTNGIVKAISKSNLEADSDTASTETLGITSGIIKKDNVVAENKAFDIDTKPTYDASSDLEFQQKHIDELKENLLRNVGFDVNFGH